jgi:hypothetical protein
MVGTIIKIAVILQKMFCPIILHFPEKTYCSENLRLHYCKIFFKFPAPPQTLFHATYRLNIEIDLQSLFGL